MTNAEIEAFIAVCEYKNISKAADKFYISQSSLSTKIKTLEEKIGCPLFTRSKGSRNITLTEEGHKFLELALKYQEIVNEMMSVGIKSRPPKLRVSSIDSMGTYLFTPVYEQFMYRMPNIILEIQDMESHPAYVSMEAGLTDLSFTVSRRESKKVITFKAFSEPMIFVCSSLSSFPSTVGLSDLDVKNEIYIPWFETFMQWHDEIFGNKRHPQIQLQIMSQLEFFLAKPNNWAVVPASAAYGLTKNPSIEKRPISFSVPNRVTNCLYVPDDSKECLVSCFLECLREHLSKMAHMGIEIYI